MSENKVLLDTSAIIEYLDLTKKGMEVKKIIEVENNVIMISSIAVAELSSKLKRKGMSLNIIDRLCENFDVIALEEKVAKNAGIIHGELKVKIDNISLADCIMMAHAEIETAQIVSCDHHFKEYKNAKIIE